MRAGGVLQSERDALPLMLALAAEGSLVAGPVEEIANPKTARSGPRTDPELSRPLLKLPQIFPHVYEQTIFALGATRRKTARAK